MILQAHFAVVDRIRGMGMTHPRPPKPVSVVVFGDDPVFDATCERVAGLKLEK